MKKLVSLIMGAVLIGGIIAGGLTKPVQAASKYFSNLKTINDTKKNMTYKISNNMNLLSDPNNGPNWGIDYRITGPTKSDYMVISFTNHGLFPQDKISFEPYLARFIPGDSLDKWVTNLTNGIRDYYGTKSNIIEKQSNMYVVNSWYQGKQFYEFYKISNGVPLCMSMAIYGSYEKDKTTIVNEAKSLFGNFNSIKSYAQNPTIYFYVVVIGSYKDKASADKMVAQAKAKGIVASISSDNGVYKVNAAAFRIKTNAEAEQKRLKGLGFNSSLDYRLRK